MPRLKHTAPNHTVLAVMPASFHVLPVIHSMGATIFDAIWARQAHPSPTIELIHVVHGHVKVHLKGAVLQAGPGDTILVPGHTIHRDEFDLAKGLETYMVHFHWEAEADYFRAVTIRQFCKYCAQHRVEIMPWIEKLRASHRQHTSVDIWLAQACLSLLLGSVYQGVNVARKESARHKDYGLRRRKKLFEQARTWIGEHYREPITLDAIAHALKISPYYLSHIFSRESNFTLFAYLTSLRMQKAKLLLQQATHNVSEAAYAVGFNDPNYFSRVFRRYFNFAPRDVRTAE
ncbi:MAG: AraC family transcriptional regulator [Kiritimatiellae bacterium]|nr:AraC family transcriptional regulator [Kiritimatiellia bacterium]